ncbi:MAG TPA: MFS transporter [Gaiellaceae bacterium]|nr:MFS transporter [Gaiellaceae bacterium]
MRYRWAVLVAGTAAATAGAALFIGPAVLAPDIREEFDASLSQVGLLLASLWVGTILTLLGWGLLADRIGERAVLALGLGLAGVLAIVAGWAGGFWTLLAVLFLASAAGASVNAASGRAVMQWFRPDERGLALGIRQTAIPLGVGMCAVVLPAVDAAGGLKASFTFLGAFCLAAALVAVAVIREAPVRDAELEGDAIPWTLRDTRLWTLSVGSGLYLGGQIPLMSFAVLFLHDAHGLSTARAGAVLAVFQACAVLSRIAAGRLSDRIGSRIRPLRWIGLASAAGLLVTAVLAGSGLPLVIAALVVAGAISMAWNGLSLTAAAELAGRARSGAAIGFQQTTLGVIGVVVPVVFANLVEATSWRIAFACSALGPIAGWAMLGRLREV